MAVLIMAATSHEIGPTIDYLNSQAFMVNNQVLDLLMSGVGLLPSSYALTSHLINHSADLVIQAGIAGSFSDTYPPATTVLVQEELLGDSGVIEEGIFKDIFDLKLANEHGEPFTNKKLINPACQRWKKTGLPFVTGVTVNEITTDEKRIEQLKEKYGADIESMEGAALHYVCLQQKIPFIQIRSVSNYVGERNKSRWKMEEAINQLNKTLITFLLQLP